MHIHHNDNHAALAGLVHCMTQDPHRFHQWFLLHGSFAPMEPTEWHRFRDGRIREMDEKYSALSLEVFFLDGPEMLLLSRESHPQGLSNFARILGVEHQATYPLGRQAGHILPFLRDTIAAGPITMQGFGCCPIGLRTDARKRA